MMITGCAAFQTVRETTMPVHEEASQMLLERHGAEVTPQQLFDVYFEATAVVVARQMAAPPEPAPAPGE